MADAHFPQLVSATRDANASTNPIFVRLTDGTTNASFTGSSLNVNITGGASSGTEYAEDSAHTSGDLGSLALVVRQDTLASSTSTDGDYAALKVNAAGALYVSISNASIAVTATDLDIRDLSSAQDSVEVLQATHDNLNANANIQVGNADVANGNPVPVSDAGGSLTVDGSVTVSATDLDIRDLTHVSDSIRIGDGTDLANVTAAGELNVLATAQPGVDIGDVTINNAAGASAVNIQDGGNSITVDGSVTVSATDLDIRDLTLAQDSVKISANTSANAVDNPIYVQVVSDVITSTEIHNYDTTSAVAADTADNHDYTVAGTTFLLKSVIAAFSGGGKVEVQTGPVASLVTKAVAFVSKEGGHVQLNFDPPIEVPSTSTGTVRVIRTNRQGQAQDVYSTIIGNDIP